MLQLKKLVGGPIAGPDYARVPSQSNGNQASPLLPTFSLHNDDPDDDPAYPAPRTLPRRPLHHRLLLPIFVVIGLFAAVAAIAFFMGSPPPSTAVDGVMSTPGAKVPPDVDVAHSAADPAADPVAAARLSLDALFARQSQTLEQAVARYSLKNDRPPPPNFDKWFAFAQEKKCLIDDYDQIQRDFEPFYQLALDNPAHFQDMIDQGRALMLKDSKGMTTINIKDGKVHMPDYRGTRYMACFSYFAVFNIFSSAFMMTGPEPFDGCVCPALFCLREFTFNLVHICPPRHGFPPERAGRTPCRLQLP